MRHGGDDSTAASASDEPNPTHAMSWSWRGTRASEPRWLGRRGRRVGPVRHPAADHHDGVVGDPAIWSRSWVTQRSGCRSARPPRASIGACRRVDRRRHLVHQHDLRPASTCGPGTSVGPHRPRAPARRSRSSRRVRRGRAPRPCRRPLPVRPPGGCRGPSAERHGSLEHHADLAPQTVGGIAAMFRPRSTRPELGASRRLHSGAASTCRRPMARRSRSHRRKGGRPRGRRRARHRRARAGRRRTETLRACRRRRARSEHATRRGAGGTASAATVRRAGG